MFLKRLYFVNVWTLVLLATFCHATSDQCKLLEIPVCKDSQKLNRTYNHTTGLNKLVQEITTSITGMQNPLFGRLSTVLLNAGFLNLGCWNQFPGVLGKVTYVSVKRLSMSFPLISYSFCQCYCHNTCCFYFGEWTKRMIKMYCTCLYFILIVTMC